ncbi:MAG TPA: proprotein convertase P-domain-containing protein [Patescibacteria group bacterium]|nr:proprotein convertase P-domain-containing protein [Patescibacteria group bacterium]
MKKLFALVIVLSFFVIIPSAWAGNGPPISDCCFVNGGTGCDDPTCEAAVCTIDPFCCNTDWDDVCVSEARALCEICDFQGVLFDTYCSPNTPEAIPDEGSITNDLPILFGPTITDVEVRLFITHTFDSDLVADLDSPGGTNVTLFTNVGGSNDDFGTSCGDQVTTFPNFVLLDGAPAIPADPGVAGTFAPEGNLDDFLFESSIGTWTLNIADTAADDEGTLQCWCLDIFSTGEGCSPGFWPRQGRVNSGLFLGCPDTNLDPTDPVQTCFACDLDNDLPNQIELATCEGIMKNANLANLKGKFGAAAKLLRQGMAGILNACNGTVDYPLTISEIRTKVCGLLDELDDVTLQEINDCKNELDANNSQACTADACPHSKCVEGGPLNTTDCKDPCVAAICAADSFCCSTSWDDICVDEVASICGELCP